MTDLMNINLTELKSTELKNLAKEYKVKNWWLLNKNSLVSALVEIKLDLEDKAAVEKANQEYQQELETQEKIYTDEKIPTPPRDSKTPEETSRSKKSKTPKVEKNEENLVTLKELAAEFNMKGTKARRLLRDESALRPFGSNRWEWDKVLHSKELNQVREILKAHSK